MAMVVLGGNKVSPGDLTVGTVRLLDPAARLAARRRWGWNHQSEALQKQDRALRGAPPDELATFALAVLDVDVPARIFQAAILELAVDVDAIIQDHVLILEDLVLISVHRFTRAAFCYERFGVIRRRKHEQAANAGLPQWERMIEAIIHVTRMQAQLIG